MSGSNGSAVFQVELVKKAKDELTAIVTNSQRKQELAAALKRIVRQLEADARSVGEPIYLLKHAELQVRLTVVGPVAVEFAVHTSKPVVFIRGITEFGSH